MPFSPSVSHRHGAAFDEASDTDDTSFANRFGLQGAHAALTSGGDALLRQLRAFAAVDPSAKEFQRQVALELHRFLADEPTLTAEQTLAVVLALAPLNEQQLARKHLARLMVGRVPGKGNAASNTPPNETRSAADSELRSQAAKIAALALARSNHPDALRELGQWLRRPNQEAEYAASALLIAQPTDLSPLLDASGPVTPLLLRTLRQLRDRRAEPFLRRVIKRASAPVQAEAALALLALDVTETHELALHWLRQSVLAPELLWASTCILFHYKHPKRGQAFQRLIDAQPTLALDVASKYVDIELLALADHLDKLPSRAERQQALVHLSRLDEAAVPALVLTLTATPELAVTAARLLARQSTPEAALALLELVRGGYQPEGAKQAVENTHLSRTLAVLALAVATARQNAKVAEVQPLLESRLGQTKGSERTATKLALAALDVAWARKWLASEEPGEMALAARVIGVHDARFRAAVSRRLSEFWDRPADPGALALSPALGALGRDAPLPVTLLESWSESSLPVAYPAIWQLCTRLPVQPRSDFSQWLANSDPEIRAAAYSGLGQNPEPQPTAVLLSALSHEMHPWARQSLIAALAKRRAIAPVRLALQRERDFNPDPVVQRLLRDPATGSNNDFWFEEKPEPHTSGAAWLVLTSVAFPPLVAAVESDEHFLLFLPDTRPLDADTFHVHTHRPPQPAQASN